MKLINYLFAIVVVAAGATEACAQAEQTDRPSAEGLAPKILVREGLPEPTTFVLREGARIAAFEMAWEQAPRQDVLRRIAAAASVMLDNQMDQLSVMKALGQELQPGSWSRLELAPQLLARYDPDYDEVRLLNEELDIAHDLGGDIGEIAAQALAEKYLDELTSAGVLDRHLYAQAALQLGYKRVGSGSRDGKTKIDRIVEYRFTFRPRLEGVELANAGIRMGILASGDLVSLRFGGVTPRGEWAGDRLQPTGKGGYREAKTNANAVMNRIDSILGKDGSVDIAWSRLMYVLPEGKKEAIVEPMFVVSLTERRQVEGEWISSRRKTLGFSVTNPNAVPIDFDAVTRHESPQPTRSQ